MNNPLLWKVTSPKRTKSFLFGTMHVRDKHAFGALDEVERFVETTDVYYSELEMPTGGLDVLSQFQQFQDGQDVTSLMSEHQYGRLRASILKSFDLDIHHFRHFYPMIIANIVQTSILSNTSDVILDYYLYQYADRLGKEIRFLESQQEQLEIFHKIPLNFQTKALIQLGRQPSKAKKQLMALLEDYVEGNTRQLYQRTKKQLGKMRHLLLYERNEQMAEKLINELQDVSAFVGVGAAHLYGHKGLIRLLKHAGFTVCN